MRQQLPEIWLQVNRGTEVVRLLLVLLKAATLSDASCAMSLAPARTRMRLTSADPSIRYE